MKNFDIPQIPTTPETLFSVLNKLDIKYNLHHHEAVFTVEESTNLTHSIPGLHCRNLFVRDKKEAMFLIVAANETTVDMKALPELLGCGRLSFGSPERLMRHLGIYPGAVCPFAVMNDRDHLVTIVLDGAIRKADHICVHPLDNRMTVCIRPDDLIRFLAHTGHAPLWLDF